MAHPDLAARLLDLARSEPKAALAELNDKLPELRAQPDLTSLSMSLRAGALAARAMGDLPLANGYLAEAIASAISAGDEVREIEARLTLAGNQFLAGDPAGASRALDRLAPDDPVLEARVRYQSATIQARAGRPLEALARFNTALEVVRRAENRRMTAMVLKNRSMLHLLLGEYTNARRDIDEALALFRDLDLKIEVAYCTHNSALVAAHSGDFPTAFAQFAEAEAAVVELAALPAEIQAGHCMALLNAGLFLDAATMAREAVAALEDAEFELDRAELLLLLSSAELASGRRVAAGEAAAAATEAFSSQGRDAFARLSMVRQARMGGDPGDSQKAIQIGETLASDGMAAAALEAQLTGAALAVPDNPDHAIGILDAVGQEVKRADLTTRVDYWATAAEALYRGEDPSGAARAAATGVRLIESQAALPGLGTVGTTFEESRDRLFHVGLVTAASSQRNRRLFDWMERAAVGQSQLRQAEPTDQSELRASLTKLSAGLTEGTLTQSARARLEREISRVARSTAATGALETIGSETLQASLRGWSVAMFAFIDDQIVALRVTEKSIRRFDLAARAPIVDRIDGSRRRLSAAPEIASGLSRELTHLHHALLEPLDLPDGPLVVIAPRGLADLPWSALPSRVGTETVVAHSATAWTRARSRLHTEGPSIVVAGPELDHAEQEAADIARLGESYTNLRQDPDSLLESLEGSRVFHAVCHGSLRTDNPMFSSLRLHKGDLFAYHLQRLREPPHVAVLSACHLGLSARSAGRALIGFTDAFLSAGTSSVIASTLPVPDTSITVDLMVDLHSRMASGERPATALANAQAALPEEIRQLYSAAFTCFGAG